MHVKAVIRQLIFKGLSNRMSYYTTAKMFTAYYLTRDKTVVTKQQLHTYGRIRNATFPIRSEILTAANIKTAVL
jgi:hypothetical protein